MSEQDIKQVAYDNLVAALPENVATNLNIDISSLDKHGHVIGFHFDPDTTDINSPADILFGAFKWGAGHKSFAYWGYVYDTLFDKEHG